MLIESIDDEKLNISSDLNVLDSLLCTMCRKKLKECLKLEVEKAETKNVKIITATLNICGKCNKTIKAMKGKKQ